MQSNKPKKVIKLKKKTNFFKKNWDILGIYVLPILSLFLTWIAVLNSNCSGWGCLGLLIIPIIGFGLGAIFAVITLIRTFVSKMKPIRLLWLIPLIIFVICAVTL